MNFLSRYVDWPLRVKMAALLVGVSLLPLLLTALLDLEEARDRLLLDTQERLQSRADQLGRELESVLAHNRQIAAGIARLPDVASYCRASEGARAELSAPAYDLLRVQQENDASVVGAALVDTAGTVTLASSTAFKGLDLRSRASLQIALKGNAASSEVFTDKASPHEPVIAYLAPVLHADGRVACIAALWVRTTGLVAALKPAAHPGALEGNALLFDQYGIQIAPGTEATGLFHPSGSLSEPDRGAQVRRHRFGDRTQALLDTPMAFQGVHEHAIAQTPDASLFHSVDPVDQRAVFAVARRLEGLPWTVFAVFPQATFDAELDRLRRQKLFVALAAMAAAGAVGVLFSHHLVAPLAALVRATRAVAADDPGVRLRESRADEIGELSRSIDAMADRVRAQAEGLEQARAALDERVRERTAALETEIAERQIAQAAIRQSQSLLQAIVDNTASLVFVKDLEGRYLLANRRFCEVYGADNATLLGQTDHQLFAPDVADALRAADRRVALGGEAVTFEETTRQGDGPHTYVSVKCPLPNELGEICGVVGISTDITERKAMESDLQSRLARLQMLDQVTTAITAQHELSSIYGVALRHLESRMPVDFACFCLLDPLQERLVVASIGERSRAVAAKLGLAEEDTLPIDCRELARAARGQQVHEGDLRATRSPLLQRLARTGLRSLVIAPLLSESRVFGLLVVARSRPLAFHAEDCEFLRQLGAHVALAAKQMQLHVALKQAYDDLRLTQQSVMQQERLRALGQMASGIAHDINNAIAPVALYAETLLERETAISERGRRYLHTISRAIEDVAATVARMREFYRQRVEPQEMAPVALNTLVQQVLDLTQARWRDMPQQRGVVIQLQTDLAADLPSIQGVESELREAMINLVLNAVDAMPDGGVLMLRTRSLVVLDSADQEATRVCLDVADSGVGMGANTRLHCMEPFFTTKGERGTGLGLAMVYGAMQRHQGEVGIESELGIGTTMSLILPRSQPRPGPLLQATHQPRIEPALRSLPPLNVLVIDDDPLILKSLGDALEHDGHFVVTANGGQRGIDAFREHLRHRPFDLVVTDLGMPYLDGRKVTASIKAMRQHTPVIMLTGWGERMLATGDLPEQVDLLLGKPVRLNDLRAALRRVVAERAETGTELSKEAT